MSRASRQKGSRGELEVVNALRAWWEEVEPGCEWMRSGELGRAPLAFRIHGDLMTSCVRFPFAVECKRIEAYSRERFLTPGAASPVWGWWAQACYQASEEGAEPMLWFRASRQEWTVVLQLDFVDCLALPPPLRVFGEREARTFKIDRDVPVHTAVAWLWPDLERVDPRLFAEPL